LFVYKKTGVSFIHLFVFARIGHLEQLGGAREEEPDDPDVPGEAGEVEGDVAAGLARRVHLGKGIFPNVLFDVRRVRFLFLE
jgi:hypothetical protein